MTAPRAGDFVTSTPSTSNTPPVGTARSLSPAQVQQLTDLQALLKPSASLQRIDDFSKWIFTSTAVVGTLGAAFSNAAFHQLAGLGKALFAAAVFFVALALFSATMALAPEFTYANPSSLESMLAAVDRRIKSRKRPLRAATVFFALALLFAGIAPFASLIPLHPNKPAQTEVVFSYDISSEGKLIGSVSAQGLKPSAPLELSLSGASSKTAVILQKLRTVAGADGKASVKIAGPNLSCEEIAGGFTLHAAYADSPDNPTILSHTKDFEVMAPIPCPRPEISGSKSH